MRALVVDDSITMRRIVIRALSLVGLQDAVEAADGVEALAALQRGPFDVILLDWNMPRMTGVEALRAIREGGCRTPVIMVTTEAEKSHVIEAVKLGANGYQIKPFAPEQLAEKVRGIVCPEPA